MAVLQALRLQTKKGRRCVTPCRAWSCRRDGAAQQAGGALGARQGARRHRRRRRGARRGDSRPRRTRLGRRRPGRLCFRCGRGAFFFWQDRPGAPRPAPPDWVIRVQTGDNGERRVSA